MADCLGKAIEAFPEADRKDIEKLFERMSRIKQEGFLKGLSNPDADFMKKAQEMLQRYRRVVAITKARALRDEITFSRADEFAKNAEFKGNGRRGISAYAEGLQAWFTGTFKNIPFARWSHDVIAGSIRDEQLSHFVNKLLESPGAMAILKSGARDAEIGKARWHLANGMEMPKDTDPLVAKIAEAWQQLGDLQLQTANDAGAFVTKRKGHMYIRTYDPNKIVGQEEAFKTWMLENVDYKRSFEHDFHVDDPVKRIDELYKNIENRTHEFPEMANPVAGIEVVGAPANLDRVMGRGRSFEFKSWEAEMEFMQKWSRHDNVAETVIHSIAESARRSALIQKMGSNPEEMYKRLTRNLSPAEKHMLDRHWNVITGKADIPGDDPVSKWMADARKIVDMGSLGYSTLRNFPDLATAAGVLKVGDKNFFESQLDMIKGFASSLTKDMRAPTMRLLRIGADSHVGAFFDRVGTTTGGHAWVSKMHEKFFSVIGQKAWTSAAEGGLAQVLAAGLGDASSRMFSELPEIQGKILQKYGIGPVEWDIIRSAVQSTDDGISMIGANAVRDLPDAAVREIMQKGGVPPGLSPSLFKRITAQKLGSYFRDRIDIGLNRAGAFQKASLLNRGWMEGTPEGQAIRFLSHFKSYSYTMSSKFTPAFYHEQLAGKSMAEGAATLAPVLVSLTALGYTGQVAWDLAHNKTPADPTSPRTIVDAMVRGGAGGVYGDFLLGTWDSRHGRDALSFLAGPEFGKIPDLMDLVSQFKEAGLERDATKIRGAALTRFITNIFPGNMPVVRHGFDYLFLNHMAEAMNPGYNQRMKTRLEKLGQGRLIGDEPLDFWE